MACLPLAASPSFNRLTVHVQLKRLSYCVRQLAAGMPLHESAGLRAAEAYRMHIKWAFRQPGKNGRPITLGTERPYRGGSTANPSQPPGSDPSLALKPTTIAETSVLKRTRRSQ